MTSIWVIAKYSYLMSYIFGSEEYNPEQDPKSLIRIPPVAPTVISAFR